MKHLLLIITFGILLLAPFQTNFAQGSGHALNFDGTNDYVDIGAIPQLNITSNLTVESWVYNQSNPSNWDGIISNVTDDGHNENGYSLNYYQNKITFWVQTVGGAVDYYNTYPLYQLDLNKWYHVAGTYDGTSIKLYINGVLVGTKAKTGNIKYTSTPLSFRLGTYYDPNENNLSNGKYDEVRIWDVARTQAEIQSSMCHKLVGNEPGLMANWRFDHTSGTTLLDQTSNHFDGTLVNMDPTTDWEVSEAPIGDASSYNYPASANWTGQSVSLSSTLRGTLDVNTVTGTPDGVHIYRVDQTPNTTTGLDNTIGSNDIYYGVFITGGTSPSYTLEYDYNTYLAAKTNEPNYNYLYNRTNNSISTWTAYSSTSNIVSNTHTKSGVVGNQQEFLLGGDAFITWDGTSFKNGSGVNSAPDKTDAIRKFIVSGSNGVLSNSASVNEMEITNSGSLTISTGKSLIVNENIINNGTVTLEENASLTQTKAGPDNNSGTGNYIVKRSGNNSPYVFNIWSSPIANATLTTVFSDANPCDIWVFDRTAQAWSHDFTAGFTTSCNGNNVTFSASDVITGGDGIMDISGGYFVPGSILTSKTYSGKVNNGDYSKAISTTNLGNPGGSNWGDDDWNLLGNPYPSALSATAFWNENAINNNRITDALYFWDEGDTTGGYNQNSDYASWNLTGGVNSGNTTTIPSGDIASGQGFWVVANTSTNVIFNNSMRTTSNSQFFKNSTPKDIHNAWFSFTSPSNYQNNILVGYKNNTTDLEDPGYDAHKLVGNTHVRFASYIGTDEFVIQSLAPLLPNDTRVIKLVVTSDETGTHTFSGYKRENLPVDFKIYLRDNLLNIDYDLANGDYSVNLDANIEYSSRFELVFVNTINNSGGGSGSKGENGNGNQDSTVTSIGENIKSDFVLIQNQEELVISNQNGLQGNIQVYDITGKLLWNKAGVENSTSQTISWNSFNAGAYFITINNGAERLFMKQVVKP